MKPLVLLLWSALAVAVAAATDNTGANVRFSNNDRLAGTVERLSADLLVWKSPTLSQPAAFFLKRVVDITLPCNPPPESAAEYEATLQLTNGDTVCGQLAAVTNQTVALDTWFAGRITFKRVMVAGVKIAAKSAFVYRGPTSLDGWQQEAAKPAWSYRRAALVSQAPGRITRDPVLPDECAITFDIAWKGDALGLNVFVFTKSTDPDADAPANTPADSRSGYEISFQRGNISLRNCGIQNFLGNTSAQALMENDRAHIEIRSSAKTGKVCVLVNDRVIENWTDPDVAKGSFGHGLQFVALNSTPLRISGIGVAAWDGVVESAPEPRPGLLRQLGIPGSGEEPKPAAPAKSKDGRMELANGDSLSGEVLSITKGVIAIQTPLGPIQLPVARLRTVTLPPGDLERCKRRNGDIRAWFADGSAIVFQLDAVKEDTLLGSSQNFGSAAFKLAAFSRIEFNIHDPDLEDQRAVREW